MILLIEIIYIFCIYNYKGCNVYMEVKLIDKYKELSIDIIKKIIEFNGSIKWRNGVFINQIKKLEYGFFKLFFNSLRINQLGVGQNTPNHLLY